MTCGSSPVAASVRVAPPQPMVPSTISRIEALGVVVGDCGSTVPSPPPSSENDPATALSVMVSKKTPSSVPVHDGTLIGQRQLSLMPESARSLPSCCR